MIYNFLNIGTSVLILFFGDDFEGFYDGVLSGVPLLSRLQLSGFPVDIVVLFGPGLIAWMFMVLFFIIFLFHQ